MTTDDQDPILEALDEAEQALESADDDMYREKTKMAFLREALGLIVKAMKLERQERVRDRLRV